MTGYLDGWNDQQRDAVAQWRQKHRALQSALDAIRVRSASPNGEIGVVVDARGAVTDIRLTPQALRLGDDRLGRLLLQTIARAQSDATTQSEATAAPFLDDPDVAQARSFLRELLDD